MHATLILTTTFIWLHYTLIKLHNNLAFLQQLIVDYSLECLLKLLQKKCFPVKLEYLNGSNKGLYGLCINNNCRHNTFCYFCNQCRMKSSLATTCIRHGNNYLCEGDIRILYILRFHRHMGATTASLQF
jgi:hypothetical protein